MNAPEKNEHSSENTTVIRVPNSVHADLRRHFKARGIKLGHGVTNIITEFLNAQPKNP
jgi:hypothetical protein